MRYVFSSNGSGKAIQETPTPELPSPKSEHWCQEQGQEFKAKTGQYGVFYSHPLPGKKWCNER
jgi:hypothetical protein